MRNFRSRGLAVLVVVGALLAACASDEDDNADPVSPEPTVEEVPNCESTDKIAEAFGFESKVTKKPTISDMACEYDVATDDSVDPIEVTWFVPTDISELGPVWSVLDNVNAQCSEEPCEVRNVVGIVKTQSERSGNTQTSVDTQFDSAGQVLYIKVYTTTRAGSTDCTTWIVLPYHETDLDPYKQGTASLTQEACGV